jgi:hypothetical protein
VIAKGMTTETRVYELIEAIASGAGKEESCGTYRRGSAARFSSPGC